MGWHHAALAHSVPPWTPAEAGIYRLNRVKETRGATAASSTAWVESSPPKDRDAELPETFVDYEEDPREYFLNAVTTILDVQTRVSDLYSRPFDQTQEQLRLLIEKVKERQEYELINNRIRPAHQCRLTQVSQTRGGRRHRTISTS